MIDMDKNKRWENNKTSHDIIKDITKAANSILDTDNMMGKFIILRKQFEKETSQEAIWNFKTCYSQEMEINMDYVEWLEKKIIRNNKNYYEKNKK